MTMLVALNHLRESATRKYEAFCKSIAYLEKRVKSVEVKETDLQNVIEHVDPARLNDLMLLNFGGEHVDIMRSVFMLYPEKNGLLSLLSGMYDHLLPRDKNGRIFFDFDKRHVEPLLNYCRDLAIWNGEESAKPVHVPMKDKRLVNEGKIIGDYFQAPSPLIKAQKPRIVNESFILSDLKSFNEQSLFDMFPVDNQFSSSTLLYRVSRDGFESKSLHDMCDGKPNTVTIVRDTEGNVFGGYASEQWASSQANVSDPLSFLFTLAVNAQVNVVQHKPLDGAAPTLYHNGTYIIGFASLNNRADLLVSVIGGAVLCGVGLLGRGFDATGNVIPRWTAGSSKNRVFTVQEIEVLQLHSDFKGTTNNTTSPQSVQDTLKLSTMTAGDSEDEILSLYTETAREQEMKVLNEAEALIAELQFVAKHCGVTLPPRSEPIVMSATADGDYDSDAVDQFASALAYIRELNAALQSADTTVTPAVADTVTINAGGRLVTTAKATLQQAPEGSILANMTSDVWGHGLDRDGNIYQDVNSELFVTVINHLRLKQLLGGTNIQVPPIVVYEEQKTALDNLLSFYMLTDYLPVKTIED